MRRSQVDYILAVAQHQSFSRAAEACFVTQSTLSALVAKVEQDIEITIFDRKTKPVSVTPAGELVLRHLQRIRREFQLLDEAVAAIKGHEVGAIRIACIPTVAPYLFPLMLNQLSVSYPGIHFTIHEMTTEQVVESIILGEIDLGIVSTPLDRIVVNVIQDMNYQV